MTARVRRRLLLALSIVLVVVPVTSALLLTGQLALISNQFNDARYPTSFIEPRILVVELPPEAAGGWTRSDHAQVITALAEGGATAIGYDVVFDQPSPHGPFDDLALVNAIREADNVVLAAVGRYSFTRGLFPVGRDPILPLPTLDDAAWRKGNVDVLQDRDGIVRTVPLVVELDDRYLLGAMSLRVVEIVAGNDAGSITVKPGTGLFVAGRNVPTDERRGLLVNWSLTADPNKHPGLIVTFEDVLAGDVDLTGRVVLVGVNDPLSDLNERARGLDRLRTPLSAESVPGVYVHANAANTMLSQVFIQDGRGRAVAGLAIMVLGLALAGMFVRLMVVPVLALAMSGAWHLVVGLQFQVGWQLDQLWPTVAVLLTAGAVVGARYVTEERERRRVAGLFRQYVPDAVVDDLLASESLVAAAEGQRIEVTVLFSDLRGFTAIAATLPPADVRALLEVYYDHSTRIIQEHGGTVMQFVGDEVFAVFGAPLPLPDHAQRAVDAARAMQAAQGAVNAELAERNIEIAWGIGLNTGEVVAAHVGSSVHKQYAVVGQAVNVGARLCSQAGPGEIVLSRWTREKLTTPVEVESLGSVVLKGVSRDPEPARLLG